MIKSVEEMLREARASVGVESIAATEMARTTAEALLIDVRQSDEFADAHVDGSLHVARGLIEFAADPADPRHVPELQPDRRIIMISGTGARAVLAAATLQSMGYRDVTALEGGIAAWTSAGLPLVGRRVSAA